MLGVGFNSVRCVETGYTQNLNFYHEKGLQIFINKNLWSIVLPLKIHFVCGNSINGF